MNRLMIIVVGVCLTRFFTVVMADEEPKSQAPTPYATEMNKKFADPNTDIQQFVRRFEDENREIFAKRQEIVRAVHLKPRDAVADIGAGTGLFTQMFAEQVGENGSVFAVDIGPAFVKYIAEQAEKKGHERIVKTVLNKPDSAELPAGSIDVAFICDTYHHFQHPEKMLESIRLAMRPGGRLVIIDFDLQKDSSEFIKQRWWRCEGGLLQGDCRRRFRVRSNERCAGNQGQFFRGVPASGTPIEPP